MKGPVRARDLRTNIAELGFEKGVVATLEHALEEQASMRQSLRDCASLLDQCITEVSKMVSVGGQLRNELAEHRRLRDQGIDIDGSPHD